MIFYGIDDETLHLVIQMQLEDLEDLESTKKGKGREGEYPDSDLAIETYKSELQASSQLVSDRVMCKSIAKANQTDGRIISSLVAQERQATRDREAALVMGGRAPASKDDDPPAYAATDPVKDDSAIDDELLRKLNVMYVSADADDDIIDQPEASAWAASREESNGIKTHSKKRKRTCNSCMNEHHFTDVAPCPCGHEYCRDCFRSLFKAALIDECLFPPRCCKMQIPVDDNRPFLSSKLVREFGAKEIEFSTPNRTYCHRPTCSTFVPMEFIKDQVATCPQCRHRTCVICRGEEHQNREDCGKDVATQLFLEVAAENGWQRCYTCRRVVELEHGCNHMTCRCGAQFCYLCGLRWKTCTCKQWNEERLLARANFIVDRNARSRLFDAEMRAQVVQREARNLMENHECMHDDWRSRSGVFTCEVCHDTLPRFIYECMQCRTRACRRCRFNRTF